MKVYNYNPNTNIFTFEEDADPDPLVLGRWLVPANATLIKPPIVENNVFLQFNESRQVWVKIEIQQPPYNVLRAAEYPPLIEYIDGIVKNDHEQIDKYIKQCLEVKRKYPKPKQEISYEI